MKLSHGEYLAGDEGFTAEFSRTFTTEQNLGFFASFTDVTADQFGGRKFR